jgi:hypothetical protein
MGGFVEQQSLTYLFNTVFNCRMLCYLWLCIGVYTTKGDIPFVAVASAIEHQGRHRSRRLALFLRPQVRVEGHQ